MTTNPSPEEDEYRKATKTVVDDAMRTDVLGPNLVRVLQDHKPANDLMHEILIDCIENDTKVKEKLGDFVEEHSTKQKGKWFERVGVFVAGSIVTGLIAYGISQFPK